MYIRSNHPWLSLNSSQKESIKNILVKSLAINDSNIGKCVASIVHAIACIEIPRDEWKSLIPLLCDNVILRTNSIYLKESSLETILYLCENNHFLPLSEYSNELLTSIIHCTRNYETSSSLRKIAFEALNHILNIIKSNIENENEMNIIMSVLLDGLKDSNASIVLPAFDCLITMMTLYYDDMMPFMYQELFLV